MIEFQDGGVRKISGIEVLVRAADADAGPDLCAVNRWDVSQSGGPGVDERAPSI